MSASNRSRRPPTFEYCIAETASSEEICIARDTAKANMATTDEHFFTSRRLEELDAIYQDSMVTKPSSGRPGHCGQRHDTPQSQEWGPFHQLSDVEASQNVCWQNHQVPVDSSTADFTDTNSLHMGDSRNYFQGLPGRLSPRGSNVFVSDSETGLGENEEPIDKFPVYDEQNRYVGPAVVYPASELTNHESARQLWEHLESLSPSTPVFPRSWALSFADQFVPYGLYRADLSSQRPLIYAHEQGSSAQFRAVKRIIALMDLNDRIVGLSQIGRKDRTTRHIFRELQAYQRWCQRDGGLDKLQRRCCPVITQITMFDPATIHLAPSAGTPDGSRKVAKKILMRKMQGLVKRSTNMKRLLFLGKDGDQVAFQGVCVPTLYTWLVIGNIVQVFTVDPKDPKSTIEELIEIDFGMQGHSLWNAIRVAMIMCKARDEMMGIKMLIPEDDQFELKRLQDGNEDA
ncbi:hypothetical protein MKZ38_006874 [Zalerion maritima]|uniref:Uncharacterized protein n=1 Tax=Zalerion maritima TaxID=339359 RepID=A0AAD5RJ19_9PEZI|nr:hypothetical protein MKZ38_006874 [Zalerion maritima]